jgi:aromatic-L-amino-acid decarboxylase
VPTTTSASSPPNRPRPSPSGTTGSSSAAASERSLWATLRCHGARRIAAAIGEDVRLAAHLAELVTNAEDFELLAGPGLSICCFRHAPPRLDEPALDAHNERILQALQRDGRVYLSNATVDGRFALRACITNFRTTRTDVERVLKVVRELAG